MDLLLMVTMISRRKISALLVVWVFIFVQKVDAQTIDFRVRAGVGVEKEITKKISFNFDYEHRFDHNLTTFDKAFAEVSLSYNLSKAFKVGGLWRYMYDMDEKRRFSTGHRAAGYIRYKKEVGDFDLKLKTMLQYGFDDLSVQRSGNEKLINRNSLGVDYNWFGTKFTPFAEYEFFYFINDPNGGIINQTRAKAGLSYKLSKASEVTLFYMFEHEFNTSSPVDAHIVGCGYNFKF